jgi:hypothetical protein
VTDLSGGTIQNVYLKAVNYGPGATSWLNANLASGQTPTSLNLQLDSTDWQLARGVYTAQLVMAGTGVADVVLPITLTVASSILHLSATGTGSGHVTSLSGPTPAIACDLLAGATGTTGCIAGYTPGTAITLAVSSTLASTVGPWGGACAPFGTSSYCALSATAPDVYVTKQMDAKPLLTRPILFSSYVNYGYSSSNYSVFRKNTDNTGLVQLTHDTPAVQQTMTAQDASWSPDGTTIAFHRYLVGFNDLFLMNADGSNLRALTTYGWTTPYPNPIQPRWSRDGALIAFGIGNGLQIAVIGANGADYRIVSNPAAWESNPSWTASGTILFVSNDGAPYDYQIRIFTMNADGTGRTPITGFGSYSCPTNSHDGRLIAWVGPGNSLELMNADGTNQVTLLSNLGTYYGVGCPLAWSADDLRIGFSYIVNGGALVGYVDVDGFGFKYVKSSSGYTEYFSDW